MVRQAHHKSRAGYSMIELLLTVLFVTFGTQMIQGGLLRAADVFGRYSNTLRAILWTGEQEGRAREALLRDELNYSESGVLSAPSKDLDWHQDVQPLGSPDLYSVRLSVNWSEGGKPQNFVKGFYAYQKKDLAQPA